MNKIQYVKIKIDKEPVEDFLLEVKKEYIFVGDYFKDCENIEEIRDKFYKETQDENISYIHIYVYTSKNNLDKDKFFEYLGE